MAHDGIFLYHCIFITGPCSFSSWCSGGARSAVPGPSISGVEKKCLDSTLMRKPICSVRGLSPRPMAHRTIALTTELMEPCCRGSTCSFIDNVILVFDLTASSRPVLVTAWQFPGYKTEDRKQRGRRRGTAAGE